MHRQRGTGGAQQVDHLVANLDPAGEASRDDNLRPRIHGVVTAVEHHRGDLILGVPDHDHLLVGDERHVANVLRPLDAKDGVVLS